MKTFKIKDHQITKLQAFLNRENADIIDVVEGCLLDSVLIEGLEFIAIAEEYYINSNVSGYYVQIAIYEAPDDYKAIMDKWEAMKKWEALHYE